jgi:competence ComEA-like helix-hairpin-helix protein
MIRLVTFGGFLILASVSALAQSTPPVASAATMPDGDGKSIVQKGCTVCHSLSVVTSKRASHTEWTQVVNQMVSRGADLTDDEIDTVIEYLSKNYGPLDQKALPTAAATAGDQPPASATAAAPADSTTSTPVNINKAGAQELQSALGLSKDEAEAVVRYREQNGNFKTWKDVAAVPGVSAAKIEDIQKRLAF